MALADCASGTSSSSSSLTGDGSRALIAGLRAGISSSEADISSSDGKSITRSSLLCRTIGSFIAGVDDDNELIGFADGLVGDDREDFKRITPDKRCNSNDC